jgi:hypothetical protein
VTVNGLLAARPADERRLVRTLDGNGRAVLSEKSQPIDSGPVLAALLPWLQEQTSAGWIDPGQASMDITDRNLYLRLVSPRLEGEVRVGEVVRAGVEVLNSEVGLGAFVVRPLLFTLACRNGAVVDLQVQRKAHVGAVLGGDDGNAWEWLSAEALVARSQATVLEMRDVVQAALGEAMFQRALFQAQQAARLPVAHPVAAVEWVAERCGLAEQEATDVLNTFLDRRDRSVWDLSSAVTQVAQHAPTFDRSVEMEHVGGRLLGLADSEARELVASSEPRRVAAELDLQLDDGAVPTRKREQQRPDHKGAKPRFAVLDFHPCAHDLTQTHFAFQPRTDQSEVQVALGDLHAGLGGVDPAGADLLLQPGQQSRQDWPIVDRPVLG